MTRIFSAILMMMLTLGMTAKTKTVRLNVIETTDVHGHFFPYDFIKKTPMSGTLARVSTYVNGLRQANPNGVILLDNGDILQGQPICYYYNFIATDRENIAASCINYMKYDAQGWGNHDVEPGHRVFDKWTSEIKCPVIDANVYDSNTGKPYLTPYYIIERDGVKVAVISLITPAIPNWLPEDIWQGLQFEDMKQSATKWLKVVKEKEHPDVIIGMFHAGREGGIITPEYAEDPSMEIAREIPGFDIILFGHDHQEWNSVETSADGSKVLLLNASCHAQKVAQADITVTKNGKKLIDKKIEGKIIDVRKCQVDEEYMAHFADRIEEVKDWSDKVIGYCDKTISTRDCFFGSSAFNDLILNLQLQLTNADIAFSAPLTFDAQIKQGAITVSDMFKLYKFENKLFVMKMTGAEIRKHLEMSYDMWVNTMTSPEDHIMLLNTDSKDDNQRSGFKNMTFNFDSAAGIDYEVDVTKPDGQKVHILRMSNGQPFDESKWYTVALNSYRANGGGELLTRGAGIPKAELDSRIIYRSDLDQRYYLMKEIERLGTISPKANNNWRFVPADWAEPALARDRKLIYNE